MSKREVRIVLTGGGTAGHVMPHFAMLSEYQKLGWRVSYIGSSGMEEGLVRSNTNISYRRIATGKFRRSKSPINLLRNFFDIFKIFWGCMQSFALLTKERPNIVFSKGGFVSVPVCFAAWLLRIPVITHESDLTPGLANRIIAVFARKILCSFAATEKCFSPGKGEYVGALIRPELFTGNAQAGMAFCHFSSEPKLPMILVMGGSLGAQRINDFLEKILPDLVQKFRVVHLTGKGKLLAFRHANYCGLEYVQEPLKDILAAADLVVARAGANSIFEFLALRKPMLLIPLSIASRGDQVHNAEVFVKNGWAHVLDEKTMTVENLRAAIEKLNSNAGEIRKKQTDYASLGSVQKTLGIIQSVIDKGSAV